jgi:hypothetical protein
MPVRNPIVFPRCARCRVPQYPELLGCHEALCQAEPYKGAGKPRKYPIGYKADYRPPAIHGWGGARRGERWEWERVGGAVERVGRTDRGRDARHPCVGRERLKDEEYYPIPYVCGVLQKHRRTVRRYLHSYQIPYVIRSHHTGMMAYISRSNLVRLLDIVVNRVPR